MFTRLGRRAIVAAVALLLVAGCTAGDSGNGDDTAESGQTGDTTPAPTGPSPGVTDDAVRVGITYVDAEALQAVGLNFDLGDVEGAYNALIDQINADGGINGRQIEPVFAPIDPNSPAPAEEACVRLTEDEDVFMVVGFFLADSVLCPISTHQTAVIGGDMTPELLAQAQVPWISPAPDTDLPEAVLQAAAEAGELDGNVAVFADSLDQGVVDENVLPTLEELGIPVVETGVTDAPPEDVPAMEANVQTIAERFESSGVDTVILVGGSGQNWPTYMGDDDSYRPELVFLDFNAVNAFASNAATTDTSVLEGAIAGGPYGPDQAKYEEAGFQDCVSTLEDAGVEVVEPADVADDPDDQRFQAAFFACGDIPLLQAWLDAAGEDLNYGALANALDTGFEVAIPGDPTPRTYGPPPDADGAPTAYLFDWDEGTQDLVLREG
jgi:hypothetical protein